MKRLTLISLLLLLAACTSIAQNSTSEKIDPAKFSAEKTVNAMISDIKKTQTPTLDPSIKWQSLKAAYAQTATADVKPFLSWTIKLIQNGETVLQQDNEFRLKKAPFTIQVRLPQSNFSNSPIRIYVNTLDDEQNYRKVNPGSILTNDWKYASLDPDCFIFAGAAEINQSGGASSLIIDKEHGWGSNYLIYKDKEETQWNRVSFSATEIVLEKDISSLLWGKGENDVQIIPLEEFSSSRLYSVLLLKYHESPIVSEDEIKKVIFSFE